MQTTIVMATSTKAKGMHVISAVHFPKRSVITTMMTVMDPLTNSLCRNARPLAKEESRLARMETGYLVPRDDPLKKLVMVRTTIVMLRSTNN